MPPRSHRFGCDAETETSTDADDKTALLLKGCRPVPDAIGEAFGLVAVSYYQTLTQPANSFLQSKRRRGLLRRKVRRQLNQAVAQWRIPRLLMSGMRCGQHSGAKRS